ncbi:hypothetical protein [uncultured Mediterranean phage uvDeep-CGR2-KM20-C133]|nr:hypothetical protein [uncultured Mediterranean phage uvDeep-CGR2-KM20-C133]
MSHNRLTVNSVDPDGSGNVSITTDDLTPSATKGLTPFVDTYLGSSKSINDLTDVDTSGASAGEGLAYVAASGEWQPATMPTGSVSAGSFDFRVRNPAYNAGYVVYTPTPTRLLLYRRNTSQVDATELPSSGTGPYLGYVYNGAPFGSSIWPTAFKMAAGHYIAWWQFRPRFDALNAVEVAIKNYTTGDYWSPRARFDPNDSTDSGPTNLRGSGSCSVNDLVGVEIRSGSMAHGDEVWAKYYNFILIKVA